MLGYPEHLAHEMTVVVGTNPLYRRSNDTEQQRKE
jgi:hypothetical protein